VCMLSFVFYFVFVFFFVFFFFFSSRRRHTRFDCDWSSDVCSSDLLERRLYPGDLGEVDVAAELLALGSFKIKFLDAVAADDNDRSEEHTSELQSQSNLVCRLLLEKKN